MVKKKTQPKSKYGFGSVVYAVQMSGPIKIGVTVDLTQRLYNIGQGCPFPIKVLAYCNGDVRMEGKLHQMCGFKNAMSGEWFYPGPDVLHAVEQIEKCYNENPPLSEHTRSLIRSCIKKQDLVVEEG